MTKSKIRKLADSVQTPQAFTPDGTKLVELSPILNQLVDEAVAKGYSRRAAIKRVAKIVNDQWHKGKLQIYGRKTPYAQLEPLSDDTLH